MSSLGIIIARIIGSYVIRFCQYLRAHRRRRIEIAELNMYTDSTNITESTKRSTDNL